MEIETENCCSQVSVPKLQLRGDEPLTIFQLSMAAIVWSAGVLVGTIAFLVELCSGSPEKKVKHKITQVKHFRSR